MSAHVLSSRNPEIDVGTPSDEFRSSYAQGWETVAVRFHAFKGLDDNVESPEFSRLGHNWSLRLLSVGDDINLKVEYQSDEGITIKLAFCCIDEWGYRHNEFLLNGEAFVPRGNTGDGTFSFVSTDQFAKRSDIIDYLVGGSLVVEVRMREVDADVVSPKPFVPENPLTRSTLTKFMDEESSDIIFEVSSGDESSSNISKRTKTLSTFHAHRFIVQHWKGAVGDLSKSSGGDSTPIAISDVTPEMFRHLLYYSYGGKIDDDDLKANAKDIIDAADKYGVVGLKLEAEATLVITTAFTMENVMDNLLYSDAKNCALLKEAVMDFLVDNADEAIKKLSFGNFPVHLVKDLLAVVAMGKKDNNTIADPSKARVSILRKMLHEKGMDTDGSREMMIARLEGNSASSDGA